MDKIIYKPFEHESNLSKLCWEEKWMGDDKGLIACWEQGKKLALTHEQLVSKVKKNELPILPWKGGYEKVLINKKFNMPYNYYAMWLGLRGDDLKINLNEDVEVTCSATGMTSIFTNNEDLLNR